MLPVRFHITKDGSHSLYSETFGQYYHNPNGAIEESIHVFFNHSGLLEALQEQRPISIFEMGFGTGLNLLLLLNFIKQFRYTSPITFESVEAWPIHPNQALELNHAGLIGDASFGEVILTIFKQLHEGSQAIINIGNCAITVHKCRFDALIPKNTPYTHFFHDAFSPEVNPDLWTPQVFKTLADRGTQDAVLVTYGASSAARASMAVGGWKIARAPGALGKREMTVAGLSENTVSKYSPLNTEKLINRWEKGDFAAQLVGNRINHPLQPG